MSAGDVRVHVPYRRGLPPMRRYLRDVWDRRQFAYYIARSELKARHLDTWFGQLWTVLNPLLLGAVYFLLVGVIFSSGRGYDFFVNLLAGLFAFYFTRNAVGSGASSVVSGGSLVTSSTLPRVILPLSSTILSVMLYLPTLLVYAGFHAVGVAIADMPVAPAIVLVPVIIALQWFINLGLTLGVAVANVYFRDTTAFLPYVLRIWLYVSPVLYRPSDLPDSVPAFVTWILWANPLTPPLEAWHQILSDGTWPDPLLLLASLGWGIVLTIVGARLFISRERDFAVRL